MGSNSVSEGTTASPILRKPKKQRHEAAHSIDASFWHGIRSHTDFSWRKIGGVIGRRVRLCLPAVFLRSPFVTYSNWGIPAILGSPRPKAIWACRTAAR